MINIIGIVARDLVHSMLVDGRSTVSREVRRVQRADRGVSGEVQNGRGSVPKIVGHVCTTRVTAGRSPAQLASVPVLSGPGHIYRTNRHHSVPVSAPRRSCSTRLEASTSFLRFDEPFYLYAELFYRR